VFNPYHLVRAFEIYDAEFENLDSWDKRALFWCQVIGFVRRYLPACYLQALAQWIYYIIENKEPLRRSFEFRDGRRDGVSILPSKAFSGLGFDFSGGGLATSVVLESRVFVNYVLSKNIRLGKITQLNAADAN
jgi:hypothetical protein